MILWAAMVGAAIARGLAGVWTRRFTGLVMAACVALELLIAAIVGTWFALAMLALAEGTAWFVSEATLAAVGSHRIRRGRRLLKP